MESILDDLRSALRSLRRSPLYASVVLGSLALGLGGAMAAFAILDSVRLRALPFPHGERLVTLAEVPEGGGAAETCGARCDVSYTTFADVLRRHDFRTLDAVIGFTSGGKVYMAGGEPLPVSGGVLTPEAFTLLGVAPALGRPLLPSDDQLGVPLVTLLSHDFWTNQFGADPGVLGRVIKLSDSQYTVVGVMPPGFDFETGSKFWLPAVPTLDPSTRPSIRSLSVLGRLRVGHTRADLAAELAQLEIPDQRGAAGPTRMHIVAAPLRDRYVAATQSYDVIFAGMVGGLLLLAVANLANLSLVRALDQRREVTVRAALGAPRGRLARQLVMQHGLLVVGGTIVGALVARWLLAVLGSVDVLNFGRLAGMLPEVDAHVWAFAAVVAVLVGSALAVAPVRVALGAASDNALRGSAGNTSPRNPWQRILLVVQVALAFALVSSGVLLQQSASALARVSVGFDAGRVLQGTPSFPHPWRVPGTYVPVTERILAELQQVPGVRAAAARTVLPRANASFAVDGGAPLDTRAAPSVEIGVSPAYFDALGVPVLRGRPFTDADVAGGAPVAIINAWAAARWWPGADPIGRAVRVDTAPGAGASLTIVGVVADHRAATATVLTTELGAEVYRPWAQVPTAFPTFVASTAGDPAALIRPFRDLLVRHVPDRPVGVARATEGYDLQWRGMRTNATQAGWIAIVGLAIAWLGIHGITSYRVRRRTREIGIRGAMGASPAHIVRLVLFDVGAWGLVGIALGLPLALGGARVLDGLLYQVRAGDPVSLVIVGGILAAAVGAATLLPTRRALHIPAVDACRTDEVGG